MVAEKAGVIKIFDLRSGKVALSLNCPENLVQVKNPTRVRVWFFLTIFYRMLIGTQLIPSSSVLQSVGTSGTFGRAVVCAHSSWKVPHTRQAFVDSAGHWWTRVGLRHLAVKQLCRFGTKVTRRYLSRTRARSGNNLIWNVIAATNFNQLFFGL